MANITIKARSRKGEDLTIETAPQGALMDALQMKGLVEGTCGGAASCGTCHVYVAEAWAGKTGERTEDEGYMLEALEDVVEVNERSRLSCQIALSEALDGLEVVVAPEA